MMIEADIRDKASQLDFDDWTIDVRQPNSFLTIVALSYDHEWPGEDDPEVTDVKSEFEIRYEHAWDEWMMMIPNTLDPRVATPETHLDFELDRHGCVKHDDFRSVVLELRSGIVHDMGVLEWLGDWIERMRLERISDVVPGMGPATIDRVYDEFGSLENTRNADPVDIMDLSGYLDENSVDALMGV